MSSGESTTRSVRTKRWTCGRRVPVTRRRRAPYPARVHEPEYGGALAVRKVRECGVFTWKHENVFLSKTLSGERVGLLPIDERYYRVYFAAFPLARFDSQKRQIERLRPEDREQEQGAEPE